MVNILLKDEYLNNLILEPLTDDDIDRVKWSDFNVYRNFGEYSLIYNTFSKSLVMTSWNIEEKLVHDLEQDDIDTLLSCNILVYASIKEQEKYLSIHKLIREIEYANCVISRYNILTTTACNARCFYCFEEGIQSHSMSKQTAENVAKYIIQNTNESSYVELRWFGGEPLVNYKSIEIICDLLNQSNRKFFSTISTNGSLIGNHNVISYLHKWNFKKVRLSLDGLRDEHNKRKNYYSQFDSFTLTLNNIDLLIKEEIQVIIRLTFDENNLSDIRELAKLLISKYKGCEYVKIYTRCIFDRMTSEAANRDIAKVKKLVAFKENIDLLLHNNGLFEESKWQPIGYQTSFCAANNPSAIVIDPMGRLTSCETITQDTKFWGDVTNGITDSDEKDKWLSVNSIRTKCLYCKFLPSCTTFNLCPHDYYDCVERANNCYQNYLLSEYLKLFPKYSD